MNPAPPASPEPPVLDVRDLRKTYRDFWRRPRVQAVRGVTFSIPRGAVYGLLGPNGSGKSTTVKMVLGLLFPTGGTISVLGAPPGSPEARRRTGYLPEETHLHPLLTPVEILSAHADILSIPRATARDRIAQLLEMLALDHARNRPVSSFSKGMARRVGLAQALLHDPDFLVLDEPTSGLDPQGTRQVKDLLLALARRGKTILMTSHLLADVQDVCSRVAILQSGNLLAEGPLDVLLTRRDRTTFTFPSPADPARAAALQATLQNALGAPVEVSHPRDSLEDYFLHALSPDTPPAPPLAPFLR